MEEKKGQVINNHMHSQIQYGEILPSHFCTIHKYDLKKNLNSEYDDNYISIS